MWSIVKKWNKNVFFWIICKNCTHNSINAHKCSVEFKEQIISLSYQKLKFISEKCDLGGPNKQTIKKHIKIIPGETSTCLILKQNILKL